MLLITMREWVGPDANIPREERATYKRREKLMAFATKLPLGEALQKIWVHQKAFKARYPKTIVVEYSLIQTALIEDLSSEILAKAGVCLVETLPQMPEDFE